MMSSLQSSPEQPESNLSSGLSNSTTTARDQLKQELLQKADEFQQMRIDADKERLDQMEKEEKQEMQEEMSKNYVRKLIGRIMKKIMGRKKEGGKNGFGSHQTDEPLNEARALI